MKNWSYLLAVILLISCKSKAVLADAKDSKNATNNEKMMSSDKIIQNHYNNKNEFSTLYIRSNAKYKDVNQSQNVSAEIKIKKDEKILVSIRFLGITMAKALITPNQVKYYEKMNGTYFEGDYQSLSQWLGTDLDFKKVQNMLLGEPIDDMTKGNYTTVSIDKFYKLNNVEDNTEKSFSFETEKYLLKQQQIVQAEKQRMFEVNYSNFQDFTSAFLPSSLFINAVQKKGKTEISIDYNSITFNEELSFPYSVPDGYDRIFIK
ncbi:DUF4292 domain-containing protein [Flavobacterium sp. RSB2_4_14]|uniref:DUF4292 domain-containing protein n=1 Tax=Flavobacterium sp. RSB2_4_14 TaxID=3447665 RepID=UPI003F2BE517